MGSSDDDLLINGKCWFCDNVLIIKKIRKKKKAQALVDDFDIKKSNNL